MNNKLISASNIEMPKTLNDSSIDYLVMLLSTDWFFEYWPVIGIGIERTKKVHIMNGCRDIVRQILGDGAHQIKEYWHASRAPERLNETKLQLMHLCDRCNMDAHERNVFLSGLERKSQSNTDLGLLEDITELMAEDYFDQFEPKLDPSIKMVLTGAVQRKQSLTETHSDLKGVDFAYMEINPVWHPVSAVDFGQISLESNSDWDDYVRGLTPDLPLFLPNYLRDKRTVSAFEYIWSAAGEELDASQKKTLQNWYLATVQAMTGKTLSIDGWD